MAASSQQEQVLGVRWVNKLLQPYLNSSHQALNLSKQENLSWMRDFLVSIDSNRRLAARILAKNSACPPEALRRREPES